VARHAIAVLMAVFLISAPAAAQSTSRPGPWALDLRGVTSPVPEQAVFYPALDATALVPSRGFGFNAGVHAYLFNLGAARVGIGADLFYVQARTKPPAPAPATGSGTTPAPAGQSVQLDMRMLTPQISFNFGSRDGWSYLSAGMGQTDVTSRTTGVLAGRRESSRLGTINVGGGARWFFKSHLAFSFDVRMHKMAAGTAGQLAATDPEEPAPPPGATPGMRILTVAVGLSIK
jgi:hypothetical protein